jgi:hypothetical protein
MMLQRLLFSLPAVLLTTAVAVNAAAQTLETVYYPVKLLPGNAPDKQIITAENEDKRCSKSPVHNGCMLFTEGTVGVIHFYLPGPPHKTKCSDFPPQSGKKVITKIELSTTPMQNDQTKGVFGTAVQDWLKNKAFSEVDASDGVVYDKDNTTGETNWFLTNRNSHSHDQGLKSFWYRITVTDCDDSTLQWVFDPRGDNEGLK